MQKGGAQIFKYRQSSEPTTVSNCFLGTLARGPPYCVQGIQLSSASNVSSQSSGGRGAFHLNSPTGGFANGIPLQPCAPLGSINPMTVPFEMVLMVFGSAVTTGGADFLKYLRTKNPPPIKRKTDSRIKKIFFMMASLKHPVNWKLRFH